MQTKLGAGFLLVALLYVIVGVTIPRLGFEPLPEIILTSSEKGDGLATLRAVIAGLE